MKTGIRNQKAIHNKRKNREVNSSRYNLAAMKYRKLIREAKDIREKTMAGKAKDNKEFRDKRNPSKGTDPLLDGENKTINDDAGKGRSVLFCIWKEAVSYCAPYEHDEVLLSPLVTKDDVKQHLLGISIFK